MTSFLIRMYVGLCDVFPWFRKASRKFMYEIMARFIREESWTYMNYGYAVEGNHAALPKLDDQDEKNRLSFQLYHHLAEQVPLHGKKVLEVGSGRGGGARMVKKYHQPELMVGLDYSKTAIRNCKKRISEEGLHFQHGDAENLPYNESSFDAVINVESSHCYRSMPRFLSEVKKVLKPGGHFLYTDFRSAKDLQELEHQIENSGFRVVNKKDITQEVVAALDQDHERRMTEIAGAVPRVFISQFKEFAGVKDTVIYNDFVTRNTVYYSYVMQK